MGEIIGRMDQEGRRQDEQARSQDQEARSQDQYSLAACAILRGMYMDDTLDSVSSASDGCRLYQELVELWGLAGMNPRGF